MISTYTNYKIFNYRLFLSSKVAIKEKSARGVLQKKNVSNVLLTNYKKQDLLEI